MNLPRYSFSFAAFALLACLCAGSQGVVVHPQPAPAGSSAPRQLTPEQIAKMPVVALPVKDFKLLSSGTGWVSTGDRLLFTTDNGAHWRDISPPVPTPANPKMNRFGNIFFLDTQAGWVLSAGDLQKSSPDSDETETVLSLTVDGGATWTAVILPRLKPMQKVGGVNFTFSDRLHGWLLIQHQSGSAFSISSLYSTSDGGRTWHEANGNPGFYGDIRAYPNGQIWVTGDSPDNEDGGEKELVVSRDGANIFQHVSLPAPAPVLGYEESYALPVFTDSRNGYEEVAYTGGKGDKSAAVLFATSDGGKTWQVDRILSNLAESSVLDKVFSTVAGSTWIHSFATNGNQPTLLKLVPGSGTTDGASARLNYYGCRLSFVTPDEGWISCSGKLSSTNDGGNTWTSIAPRARNGILTTDPARPVKSVSIQTKRIASLHAPTCQSNNNSRE
jgi:photosystem II stability/assembly factor-like uncharacterized protein